MVVNQPTSEKILTSGLSHPTISPYETYQRRRIHLQTMLITLFSDLYVPLLISDLDTQLRSWHTSLIKHKYHISSVFYDSFPWLTVGLRGCVHINTPIQKHGTTELLENICIVPPGGCNHR